MKNQKKNQKQLEFTHGIIYNTDMNIYDIVLDTNVLVSALKSKKGVSFKLLTKVGKNIFNTHISVPLIFEYEDVLKREIHNSRLTQKEIDDIIDYICSVSEEHELYYLWRPCLNDPKDEMILELAVTANCEYIVTHNIKDYKNVKGFNVRAITPSEFLKLIGG